MNLLTWRIAPSLCSNWASFTCLLRCMFQAVRFDIPSFVNQSAVPKRACTKTIGYRHMCRFHAKTLYEQPILDGLQYVWRLDDDSFITKPIRYDVFRLMRDGRILYAYRSVVLDNPGCIMGIHTDASAYRSFRLSFRYRYVVSSELLGFYRATLC